MTFEVRQGDCVELMAAMPACSVDSVVCDPPAGIGFMSKTWDHHRGGMNPWVEWMAEVLREALRVCKPGAHAFVWSLPRTSHWTGSALELAGWEVRDVCTHLFGSGFPKSHNLPNGFGTALKPAAEFWWLARKPLSGTVAQTVLEHGTGALNVDGCRVGDTVETRPASRNYSAKEMSRPGSTQSDDAETQATGPMPAGRWPANVVLSHMEECVPVGTRKVKTGTAVQRNAGGQAIFGGIAEGENALGAREDATYANPDGTETVEAWRCHSECAVRLLDEQTGELAKGSGVASNGSGGFGGGMFGDGQPDRVGGGHGYVSSPSRFFYCAKSGAAERSAGLNGDRSTHPTVKPISLMRWLVRLVTPPEGTVLDPFCGSGSTGCAAVLEGFDFIGLEWEDEYVAIAEARIAWWHKHRGDGEAAEILAAGEARDEVEATGQLGMFDVDTAERDRAGREGEASAERTYTDRGGSNFAMKPGRRR